MLNKHSTYSLAWEALNFLRRAACLLLMPAISACEHKSGVATVSSQEASALEVGQGCRPLKPFQKVPATVAATGAGKQCLVQDLVQHKFYDVVEGRGYVGSPGRAGIVAIFKARDVDLDLRGHVVAGTPFNDTVGIHFQGDSSRIRVHGGEIRTPGSFGVGVWMVPFKSSGYLKFDDKEQPEDLPPMKFAHRDETNKRPVYLPWNYQPPTHYTLENLKIESGGRGVIMAGSHNVLRNSTIEVDSPTAVVVYGPNAVIEGNTFIVHRKPGEPEGTSAALKLRDAHGAVVRNNRFIVKGFFSGKAEAAINLIESSDVLIENNVAEGVKQWVRKDPVSKTIERGNQIK